MKNKYHILNGDSLKAQFPDQIDGEIIVARECLVDGDVQGESLGTFYKTRAKFLAANYDGIEESDYYTNSMSEFLKIEAIPKDSEIHLWFEWDLFCQVNFWFVIHILYAHYVYYNTLSVYFVRPKPESKYSFGHMSKNELIAAFQKKSEITEVDARHFSHLWKAYQQNNIEQMLRIGRELGTKYPDLIPAIQAHADRIPMDGNPGRVSRTLMEIIRDLGTKEFESIFKEFCKRESIYGFGDAQVRRLLLQILEDHELLGYG